MAFILAVFVMCTSQGSKCTCIKLKMQMSAMTDCKHGSQLSFQSHKKHSLLYTVQYDLINAV